MWDKLIDMAKGVAWGLVILILICMCQGCKSTRHTERILVSDQEGVRVTKIQDSIDYMRLAHTIKSIVIDTQINTNTERITLSDPNEQGMQHITAIERSQAVQTTKVEQQTAQTLVNAYKRTQRSLDSLRRRLQKIEQSKEEAQKTSGGVFSWSGKEVAAILAIVLLLVVIWIIAKGRGYI